MYEYYSVDAHTAIVSTTHAHLHCILVAVQVCPEVLIYYT